MSASSSLSRTDIPSRRAFGIVLIAIIVLTAGQLTPAASASDSTLVRLGFTGDMYLGHWVNAHIDTHGVDYPFEACRELFQSMDLVVGNLESPITTHDGVYVEKTFTLQARPGMGKALSRANVRAVTLANNHILDFGPVGLRDTMDDLDAAAVSYFGAGVNKDAALREASFTINGQTVALLGFSATFPEEFWATDSTAGTAFPYDADVIRRVSACAETHDIVAAVFHWGAEKRDNPKDYQIALAHLAIDHGADLVIGHHPHVVNGLEWYESPRGHNGLIYYSLGNFAFASFSETARLGLVADVTFQDGEIAEAQAVPVNVYNVDVRFQPRVMQSRDASDALGYLQALSDSLGTEPVQLDLSDGRVLFGE